MAERIFTNAYMVQGVGAKTFYIVSNFSTTIKAKSISKERPKIGNDNDFIVFLCFRGSHLKS